MQWYYANGGQRFGPVTPSEMASLVQAGTVRMETLVWHAGMANWLPWREVGATAGLPPAPEAVLRAPTAASPPETVDAEEFWRRLRANGYHTSAGSCLARGWTLYKNAFGPCLGVTLLAYVIMGVAGVLPVLSFIAAFVVNPHLTSGLWWYFLRRARGEEARLDHLFDGYRRSFGQLAILALLQFLIVLPAAVIAGLIAAMAIPAVKATGNSPALIAVLVVLLVVFCLALAVVMFRFMLAYVIVIDAREQPWAALKLSWRIVGLRFWSLLGLALLIALLSIAGALALIVGLLLVLPLFPAAFAYAYDDAVNSALGRRTSV